MITRLLRALFSEGWQRSHRAPDYREPPTQPPPKPGRTWGKW